MINLERLTVSIRNDALTKPLLKFWRAFRSRLHPLRDHFQSFKNAIYDIGLDLGASYYRFGGMMKGYIRRVFGDALVDSHLAMKRQADPAMILNRDVIF